MQDSIRIVGIFLKTTLVTCLTIYEVFYYNCLFNRALSMHTELNCTFVDYNYLSWATLVVYGLGVSAYIFIYWLYGYSKSIRIVGLLGLSGLTLLLNASLIKFIENKLEFDYNTVGYDISISEIDLYLYYYFPIITLLWYYILSIAIRKQYNIFSVVPLLLLFSFVYYLIDGRHWVLLVVMVIVALLGLPGILISLGLRNKYPLDFLNSIEWLNKYFISHGFEYVGERYVGTSHPECIMASNDMTVTVRYNASLFGLPLIDIIANGGINKEWHFPFFTNHDRVFGWLDDFMRNNIKDTR